MKRIAATALTIITTTTLSTGMASGQIASDTFIQENEKVFNDVIHWHADHFDSDSIRKDPTSSFLLVDDAAKYSEANSSEESHASTIDSGWKVIGSSIKKDLENSDPLGTTLDTVVALGALAALGAVLYGIALQAGIPLPYIDAE